MSQLIDNQERSVPGKIRVTIYGSILDLILGIAKIIIGLTHHSTALITDGIHSLSDLATDGIVIWATMVSDQEADDDHPYGHQRFETIATVGLGLLLLFVSGALVYESIAGLFTVGPSLAPEWPVLVVAALSIVSKEWIYQYTLITAKKYRSTLLAANAWHSRTDALSSVIVLIGAGAAMLGIGWADQVAAILVAGFLVKIGWSFVYDSLRELVDTSISATERDEIEKLMLAIPGVLNVHDLRSRTMGDEIYIDVHICVPVDVSVTEGHQIGAQMVRKVVTEFPRIRDIVFHIDTELDDLDHAEVAPMATRGEVLEMVTKAFKKTGLPTTVDDLTLHYQHNTIRVQLFLPINTLEITGFDLDSVKNELTHLLSEEIPLHSLELWFGNETL